jgi:hypothetical protein
MEDEASVLTSLDVKLRGAGPPLEGDASILLNKAAMVEQVHRRVVPVCVYEQALRACTTHMHLLGRLGAPAQCYLTGLVMRAASDGDGAFLNQMHTSTPRPCNVAEIHIACARARIVGAKSVHKLLHVGTQTIDVFQIGGEATCLTHCST